MKYLFIQLINLRFLAKRHPAMLLCFTLALIFMVLGIAAMLVIELGGIYATAELEKSSTLQMITFEQIISPSRINGIIDEYNKANKMNPIINTYLYSPNDEITRRFIIGITAKSDNVFLTDGDFPDDNGVLLMTSEYDYTEKSSIIGDTVLIKNTAFLISGTGYIDAIGEMMNKALNYPSQSYNIKYPFEMPDVNSPVYVTSETFVEMDIPCYGLTIYFENDPTSAQISFMDDLFDKAYPSVKYEVDTKAFMSKSQSINLSIGILKICAYCVIWLANIWLLIRFWLQTQVSAFSYYQRVGAKRRTLTVALFVQIAMLSAVPTAIAMGLYLGMVREVMQRWWAAFTIPPHWFAFFAIAVYILGSILCLSTVRKLTSKRWYR